MLTTIPHDPAAEMAVISGPLFRPSLYDDLSEIIKPQHFYSPANRIIWEAIGEVILSGNGLDLVSLSYRLAANGHLERIGGNVYLAECAYGVVTTSQVINAARVVADLAQRREIIAAGQAVIETARDMTTPAIAGLDAARKILEGAEPNDDGTGDVTAGEYSADYLQSVEELAANAMPLGAMTPFDHLNHLTAGIQPGEVGIIAARPGNGKTALGLNLAYHAAASGLPTGIVSVEMSKRQLVNRIFAFNARVDAQAFRSGRFGILELEAIRRFSARFSELPLLITDNRGHTPASIRRTVRNWKRRNGLGLLVIDYLQLLTPDRRNKVREVEVAEMSRTIKIMAGEFEVPVWLMVQVSREAVKDGRGLRLHHLRESGAIEQDADLVLLIQPWEPKNPEPAALVKVDVAKSRSSSTGSFNLVYHKRFVDFREQAEE